MNLHEVEVNFLTKNKHLNKLEEKNYTAIDSFTINQYDNSITGLVMLNRDEYLPESSEVHAYLSIDFNKEHMRNRVDLANILGVPLYIISTTETLQYSQILKVKGYNENTEKFEIVNCTNNNNKLTFTELFNFFKIKRNEQKKNVKPLSHFKSQDLIKKLSDSGINLGGNLDGFKLDKENNKIHIVEFSKIGAKKSTYDWKGNKTKNYNFQKYIGKDFGRWYALETLRKSLNNKIETDLQVIVWSFINSNIKIFKDVVFKGDRNPNLKAEYLSSSFIPDTEKHDRNYQGNTPSF